MPALLAAPIHPSGPWRQPIDPAQPGAMRVGAGLVGSTGLKRHVKDEGASPYRRARAQPRFFTLGSVAHGADIHLCVGKA